MLLWGAEKTVSNTGEKKKVKRGESLTGLGWAKKEKSPMGEKRNN